MLKSKEFRNNIITGVSSSLLFLVLFQPIINILGQFIRFIGVNLYSGTSDAIYRYAARGYVSSLDFLFYGFATSIVFGGGAFSIAFLSSKLDGCEK